MDVEQILEVMQSHGLVRLSKISGDYYQIYCPIHSDGQERKPSCGVLLHDIYRNGQKYSQGMFHCFTCHLAKSLPDVLTLILKQKGISSDGMKWLVENVPGFTPPDAPKENLIPDSIRISVNTQNTLALKQLTALANKNCMQFVSEEELAKYRYTVDYMYERKLTDEIIAKYDVGFDPEFLPSGRKKPIACITFPVRDAQGRTLFFCRRAIEQKFYHYPTGVQKPLYGIYELPKNVSSVCIMESCINALTAESWGYDCVALMGTGNAMQIKQLQRLGAREFILCLDGDDAGHKASAKLRKALKGVAIVWTVHIPDGKDVNDLEKSEFDELYENRTQY